MITGKTKLLGVIGDPIEHSLSPVMHNAAINSLGVDYVYVPFQIKPADLITAIATFRAIGLQGFNITMPHKQAILPLLEEINPVAQAVGAVNTVYRTATGWGGTNTDVAGFIAPLQQLNRDWPQQMVVVLGAGGAARAIVAGCVQLGCRQIHLVGRQLDKLQTFQESWGHTPLASVLVNPTTQTVNLPIHSWDQLGQLLPQTDLLINTTPIGMAPHTEQSPVDQVLMKKLKPKAIVYDLIYTPRPTLLLQQAQQHGAIIIDGLEMLVQQGARALEIWLNQPVSVDVMRQSLLAMDH